MPRAVRRFEIRGRKYVTNSFINSECVSIMYDLLKLVMFKSFLTRAQAFFIQVDEFRLAILYLWINNLSRLINRKTMPHSVLY